MGKFDDSIFQGGSKVMEYIVAILAFVAQKPIQLPKRDVKLEKTVQYLKKQPSELCIDWFISH